MNYINIVKINIKNNGGFGGTMEKDLYHLLQDLKREINVIDLKYLSLDNIDWKQKLQMKQKENV